VSSVHSPVYGDYAAKNVQTLVGKRCHHSRKTAFRKGSLTAGSASSWYSIHLFVGIRVGQAECLKNNKENVVLKYVEEKGCIMAIEFCIHNLRAGRTGWSG